MTDEETEPAETGDEAGDATTPAGETNDGETYVCGACGKEFDSREELERHVHDVGIVD